MDSEGVFHSLLDVPLGFISVSPTVSPAQILAGLELWGPHQCPEVVAAVFVDL